MPDAENKKIEMQAEDLLKEMGISKIPVPVEKIAKHLGAKLKFSPLDEELSGMVYIKDDEPIIGVNALHHPNRQRFTIAHEIAHLCMHRSHIEKNVHVDKGFQVSVLYRDAKSAEATEELEIQANQFAAALLVPKHELIQMMNAARTDIDEEPPLEKWAKKFKVSKQMLDFRIRNLSQDQ